MDNLKPTLAKGLDAIFSFNKQTEIIKILEIDVNKITPGKYQPRLYFNESELSELAQSIQSQGLLQPILIRQIQPEQYELIAGERRWRAVKLIGWQKIPAIIKNISDEVAAAFSLIENIQRADLNPIEEAFALKKLHVEFGLTHEEIATRVGKSRSAITNILRLLNLSQTVQEQLIKNNIEIGHGRALITLDAYEQEQLTHRIVKEKLTVRKVEEIISQNKLISTISDESEGANLNMQYQKILSDKLSMSVTVKLNQKGRGKIVIYVDSPEDVKEVIQHIK